jgi:hypothetical protein
MGGDEPVGTQYRGEVYEKWLGLQCRKDPIRAAQEDRVRELRSLSHQNAERRAADIEELREMRVMLAGRLKQVNGKRNQHTLLYICFC